MLTWVLLGSYLYFQWRKRNLRKVKSFAQLLRIRSQIPLTASTLPRLSGTLVGEGALGPGLIDVSEESTSEESMGFNFRSSLHSSVNSGTFPPWAWQGLSEAK